MRLRKISLVILMEKYECDLLPSHNLSTLIGKAPSFVKAIDNLPDIAKSNSPVLISGETGTGKELVAQAIHHLSARRDNPFVAVNCGLLQDSMLEDELFGHERGAFTDAYARRVGVFAQAEKGTLFLDEADSMSRNAQIALLRVLQDKRYRLIGGSREQQADVRIIVATNANLPDLVRSEKFRSDLYYRLCVFSINLPPLRDREEDLPILIAHFVKKHRPPDRKELQLAPDVYSALSGYYWPGNVRELENAIIRGIYLSRRGIISIEHLGVPVHQYLPEELLPLGTKKKEVIEAFEREYLIKLMHKTNGDVRQAARIARKDRSELYRLLRKHRVKPQNFNLQ